jgi:hypothetical protein
VDLEALLLGVVPNHLFYYRYQKLLEASKVSSNNITLPIQQIPVAQQELK